LRRPAGSPHNARGSSPSPSTPAIVPA
jgi:hypothetical protein